MAGSGVAVGRCWGDVGEMVGDGQGAGKGETEGAGEGESKGEGEGEDEARARAKARAKGRRGAPEPLAVTCARGGDCCVSPGSGWAWGRGGLAGWGLCACCATPSCSQLSRCPQPRGARARAAGRAALPSTTQGRGPAEGARVRGYAVRG